MIDETKCIRIANELSSTMNKYSPNVSEALLILKYFEVMTTKSSCIAIEKVIKLLPEVKP